jgi:hypothetical protein
MMLLLLQTGSAHREGAPGQRCKGRASVVSGGCMPDQRSAKMFKSLRFRCAGKLPARAPSSQKPIHGQGDSPALRAFVAQKTSKLIIILSLHIIVFKYLLV